MEGESGRREDIARLFAQAPFSDAGWDTALRALADATGSARAQLVAFGKDHVSFNWVTDVDEGYAEEFLRIEGYRADVNYRVAAIAKPFEVTWERHYDAVRKVSTNDVYLDHVRKYDAEQGAQVILVDRPGAFFGVAALHARSDGATNEAQRKVLGEAAPHVLRAIQLQKAVEHRGVELLRGSLEAIRHAAILLDGTGKVCAMTQAAEKMLGWQTFQVRAGALRAVRADIDRELQRRLSAALADSPPQSELWISTAQGRILVEVCTLPRQDWNFGFSPRVVVSFRSPLPASDNQVERLCAAFGLTGAEGQIVALLAQGQSRQEAAHRRGVSVQTVATQLRTIFQKCGVNREAELVSMARAVIELGNN
ncbi:helix-turn-helix transcriptional regulator [Novosphingobium sp. KN65.2]|uniref:helix-turn-helix transcriptional regulator n=1 Tax=Novosphingobium sp. KN65.2 TaxID=1478134 RepID=UPI0005EA0BC3|nr:helix-turn-helix transcriptional regulator [Novosphingobium sp. KN65.2]CDO37579.1 putative Regulatory protein, LuxR [Novosphingobium sp. KN65.2]